MTPSQRKRMIHRFFVLRRTYVKGSLEYRIASRVLLGLGYGAGVRAINKCSRAARKCSD